MRLGRPERIHLFAYHDILWQRLYGDEADRYRQGGEYHHSCKRSDATPTVAAPGYTTDGTEYAAPKIKRA